MGDGVGEVGGCGMGEGGGVGLAGAGAMDGGRGGHGAWCF